MLKRHIFSIFLLCLLHRINCQVNDDFYVLDEMTYLTQRIGFCLNYFQYLITDGFFIGKLTVPNMKYGDTVKLQFFHKTIYANRHFNGSLFPDESPQDIVNKVQTGQPITYRVDFPVGYAEPELNSIFVNGNELCSTIIIVSGQKLILEHTLEYVNNSLSVFTYNINMPHFTQVANCGLVDKEITSNALKPSINGDALVRRGEYPWLSAIYKKQKTGNTFSCGGSLVTSQMILTAAHCFQGLTADDVVVELGRLNLNNSEEDSIVMREIEEVILHPAYKPILNFSDSDLALLKLKEPVSFSQFIRPICLWSEPADESLIVGRSGAVAGWGADENGNTITAVPKKLKTNIVSKAECIRSSPVYTAIATSNTLCAGNHNDAGPCEGDSGAGLMIYRNGLWMLRGVISAGLTNQESCNLQEYTVYCDIAKHMPWLDTYIGQQEQPIIGDVKDICGKSGTEYRTEHPWLAAIYTRTQTGLQFHCTGVLISSLTVLTTANCFDWDNGRVVNANNLRIYFGRYDLNSIKENGVATRSVETLSRHPNYKKTGGLYFDNDVALLHLTAAVSFTQYIKPICLWSESSDQSQDVGKTVTLLSWNRLRLFDESLTIPQLMEVNITSFDQCQLTGYNVDIPSSFLCTPRFGNNADGILMFKRNGRWLLRGLSTANLFYLDRYNSAEFRVYTDIREYLPWIESNMLSEI